MNRREMLSLRSVALMAHQGFAQVAQISQSSFPPAGANANAAFFQILTTDQRNRLSLMQFKS